MLCKDIDPSPPPSLSPMAPLCRSASLPPLVHQRRQRCSSVLRGPAVLIESSARGTRFSQGERAPRDDRLPAHATGPQKRRSRMAKRGREEEPDFVEAAHDLEAAAGRDADAARKTKARTLPSLSVR